jgi:hypothetical protein
MVGRPRTQLLLDFITDFEHGRYRLPVLKAKENQKGVPVNPVYRAHRAVTVADVYAPGKWNSHLPDDLASMALAHHAIEKLPQPITKETGVPKDGTVRKADQPFNQPVDEELTVAVDGSVRVVDDRYGPAPPLAGDTSGRDPWEAMSV